ncbi:MAG: alpha/beta hydrolase [Polyangiales bacterium]
MPERLPELDRTVEAPDGTPIAFTVFGSGAPVVLTNGLTTSTFFWKYVAPRLATRHTVVLWDFAGHGASAPGRTPHANALEAQPAILTRIMDAAGIAQAAHVGWSLGCQVVLELVRQAPARCTAVGLLFGPAEHALSSTRLPLPSPALRGMLAHPQGATLAALFQHLTQVTRLPGGFGLLRALGLVGARTADADLATVLALFRAVDPGSLRRMACSAEQHSALDALAACTVPVLVMAGDADPFAPFETVGAQIHRAQPRATLVRLPHATHTALLDHADEIVDALEALLAQMP